MSKRQKSTSLFNYFAKHRRNETAEIEEQETEPLRSTFSNYGSESTESSLSEKDISLDIASDDIAKILPPFKSSDVDKLYMLKNAFRPVGKAAMTFDFRKCCTAKGQRFRYLNENHFRSYSWLVYSKNCKGLFCKYCAIFSTSLVNSGVGKNRQKPRKLVIEPLCTFNKLTGSDGYLYEHDRLEYHKSIIIKVRR